MIHDTKSVQISQKQDERNIYVIMKTMCPPGYHSYNLLVIYTYIYIYIYMYIYIFTYILLILSLYIHKCIYIDR